MSERLINDDEWYPVYHLELPSKSWEDSKYLQMVIPKVDIPDDKLAWAEKVFEEFELVQDYLAKLRRKAKSE